MAYTYPENRLEIVDGQLRPIASVPSDVVLIIERSFKGPSNTLYLVDDLEVAKNVYGDRSPLLTLASRARIGGAQNIALYRIGGSSYEYLDLFGPNTSLSLTEQSVSAADNIKVYVGPEPKNSTRQAVIIYEGSKIIYSNVLGGEVNSSRVVVEGFNKIKNTVKLGTLASPVPFTDILASLSGDAISASIPTTHGKVDGADWVKIDVSTISGFTSGTDDLSTIKLTKTGTLKPITYTVSSDKTSLLINNYVNGTSAVVSPGDTVEVSFTKKLDPSATQGIIYTKGTDGMQASNKQLYEIYDSALASLDLISTKCVLVGDIMNVPNIASGSQDTAALEYLLKGEDENGYTTYEWSKDKYIYRLQGSTDQTTTDISQAEINLNGRPVIVKQYGEVDFVHRLGMFAFSKTVEGQFLNVVIGVEGPASRTPRAIMNWVGTSPKYDINGNIVENGSGLLGHRLMVGTVDYRGGYFATANGFVDGDVLTDITGFPVDLGKYLSIVVSQVAVTSNIAIGSSGASVYAGLVSTLGPGNSTTNKLLPNSVLLFDLKESQRKALSKAGYVVFQEKPKGLSVYSGDVATRDNSDFDYISTAITVSEVSRLISETTDGFIGQGIDLVSLTALQTQLTTVLANAQKAGWFISYQFKLKRNGANTILIPFVIEAKDELRQISNVVRLTRTENFIEL